MPNVGETITVKGKVISVKPKWDRFDPDALGVMVKPRGANDSFWFRWSFNRGQISRGDIISFQGEVTGESDVNPKYGGKTIWMKGVKISGTTCSHAAFVKNGKGYKCDGCGTIATVTIKKGA